MFARLARSDLSTPAISPQQSLVRLTPTQVEAILGADLERDYFLWQLSPGYAVLVERIAFTSVPLSPYLAVVYSPIDGTLEPRVRSVYSEAFGIGDKIRLSSDSGRKLLRLLSK